MLPASTWAMASRSLPSTWQPGPRNGARTRSRRRSIASLVSRRLCLSTLAVLASGASLAPAACAGGSTATGGGGEGPGGLGGAGYVDWGGTTGSGEDELNGSDPDLDEDTYDEGNPECGPDSEIDDAGQCIQSCEEAGGECFDGDATDCGGDAPLDSWDCGVCCPLFDEDGEIDECPPEGCEEEGCDPADDPECEFTETCPDAVCDEDAGESCSTCPDDCGECAPECGDGECNGDEECSTCAEDCGDCPAGAECGDAYCDADASETCANCNSDCGKCFKVLTWDIAGARRKGHKPETIEKTLTSIANRIAREKPDLAAIQAIEVNTKRSGCLDMASFIAKRTKMFKRFGAAYRYGDCSAKEKGYIGVAVFTKHSFESVAKVKLPGAGEFDKHRLLLNANVALGDELLFTFATTKLGHPKGREQQATTIDGLLGLNGSAILTGNMGEESDGPAFAILTQNSLADVWEYEELKKRKTAGGLTTRKRRIDYVLPGALWYPPTGAVEAYVLPAKRLSSHRPVVMLFNRSPEGDTGGGVGGGDGVGGGGAGGGEPDEGTDDGYVDECTQTCTSSGECESNICGLAVCVDGRCAECLTDADCTDPDFPACDEINECNSP